MQSLKYFGFWKQLLNNFFWYNLSKNIVICLVFSKFVSENMKIIHQSVVFQLDVKAEMQVFQVIWNLGYMSAK